WILDPKDAPKPKNDDTVNIYRAVGEINEIREILRRCVEDNISFDEVEILYTESATYIPAIYELFTSLMIEECESIPVTFSEGIPIQYSRPARALTGFFSWIREDYPQNTLVRMFQEGLLQIENNKQCKFSFNLIADILQSLRIGNGIEQYKKIITDELIKIEENENKYSIPLVKRGNTSDSRVHSKIMAQGLKTIQKVLDDLWKIDFKSSQCELLDNICAFLKMNVRNSNKLDEYSSKSLIEWMKELNHYLNGQEVEGFEIIGRVEEFISQQKIIGEGARQGCIHVSPVKNGGHTGRQHTFIVGLDDSRFPGGLKVDPVLWDTERISISKHLPTSSTLLSNKEKEFAYLLSRLRGNITMSYSCENLIEDSERSPSRIIWSAFRLLSESAEENLDALYEWLSHPFSFAPQKEEKCLISSDWWLWRLFEQKDIKDPLKIIGKVYPRVGNGQKALEARASNYFTEYDGYVKEAGKDLNPYKIDGMILSATALELLGQCPLEFFLKHVLSIEKPEKYELPQTYWLEPYERGTLLHTVFYDFMYQLIDQNKLPDLKRDLLVIFKILNFEIMKWKALNPPYNNTIFERDESELRQAVRIFLIEEEELCKTSHPKYCEVAVGMKPEGKGTNLDSFDPVSILLKNGKYIRARGKIDRIDKILKNDNYALWDYKTGGTWKYRKDQKGCGEHPYWQGRVIQNALYVAMAEELLSKKTSSNAQVSLFGYFFPSIKGEGERISSYSDKFETGNAILGTLTDMISLGCFPMTNKSDDVKFSDYNEAFGDIDFATDSTANKLENMDNVELKLFKDLRSDG
ncbi:PD-(D/E)XK nuclease family protein, partial [candidate division KSB1 bacterium]